jgi:chitin synthase
MDTLALVADMLGVDAQALHNVLTFKTTMIRSDVLTVILTADQAREQCNALIQVLTSLLFSWVVARINHKTSPPSASSPSSIGLLDFSAAQLGTQKEAGFHHFCLGLANERLHHHFFQVAMPPCLELLMRPSKSLTSLLNTMTDSTLSGKRTFTDAQWMDSVIKYNGQHPALTIEKSSTGKRLFGVAHYTGTVIYDPDGFLHGNSNFHFPKMDFAALFRGSSCWNPFVVDLFSSDTSSSSSSVLGQTQAALDDLLADADQPTTMWSVQSIRPNDQGDPTHFDTRRVQQQIDALNLAALVRHVKSAWPHAWSHEEFVQRYSTVLQIHHPAMPASPHSWCDLVLDAYEWTEQQARVDDNKVQ